MKAILEQGKTGSDGLAVDTKGILIPNKKIPVEFNYRQLVGTVVPYVDERGLLQGDFSFIESFNPSGLYPSISYEVLKSSGSTIQQCRLVSIVLSVHPNADDTIPAIEL